MLLMEKNPTDAMTLKQLDVVDFETITKDIDLQDTYNVIHSKQQTFNEMNTNRNTLVCYEDARDVFVSRKESAFSNGNSFGHGKLFYI